MRFCPCGSAFAAAFRVALAVTLRFVSLVSVAALPLQLLLVVTFQLAPLAALALPFGAVGAAAAVRLGPPAWAVVKNLAFLPSVSLRLTPPLSASATVPRLSFSVLVRWLRPHGFRRYTSSLQFRAPDWHFLCSLTRSLLLFNSSNLIPGDQDNGGLTPALSASCPDAAVRLMQSRHRAAMRCRAVLG